MKKIIVADSSNFYFGREADVIEITEIMGQKIYRVAVGNVTFALKEKDVENI